MQTPTARHVTILFSCELFISSFHVTIQIYCIHIISIPRIFCLFAGTYQHVWNHMEAPAFREITAFKQQYFMDLTPFIYTNM